MIRAIFTGDTRYNECNVFEYNNTTKHFHMIKSQEVSYSFDIVMSDKDFIVFVTDGDSSFQVDVINRNLNLL